MSKLDIKDSTASCLLNVYRKKGFEALLSNSSALLKKSEYGSEFRDEKGLIKGEVAEIVLYCILVELCKSLNFDTIIEKGLFVQDPVSKQVTEIDLLLVTPFKIFIFESKSYSGKNKELQDKCQLFRGGELCADVYEQNKLHTLIFNKNYGMFTKQEKRPYTMVLFDYASNLFVDKREAKYRNSIPVANQRSVIDVVLNQLRAHPEKKVNVLKVREKINLDKPNQKALEAEHRRQLGY